MDNDSNNIIAEAFTIESTGAEASPPPAMTVVRDGDRYLSPRDAFLVLTLERHQASLKERLGATYTDQLASQIVSAFMMGRDAQDNVIAKLIGPGASYQEFHTNTMNFCLKQALQAVDSQDPGIIMIARASWFAGVRAQQRAALQWPSLNNT